MSTTARISVNVDGEIKQNAQRILGEIGMDMTTAIDLMLRTIVREERIPFELRTEKSYREHAYRQYIRRELELSKLKADGADTIFHSHDDVMRMLAEQREARSIV